jgi:dTMP kinase
MSNLKCKGKLIVIEGSDSSGKATQVKILFEKLKSLNLDVKKVEFPDYKSNSSALVKMYLNGEFGTNAEEVNPYAASTFYSVDRFASYQTQWKSFYENGGIVLADRYTTSNMVHQASKIKDENEKKIFLDWLWDLELVKFGLPVPDKVIFLNMPPEFSVKLMEQRKNKFTGKKEKDIHENNFEYLSNSYNNACRIALKYNWTKVNCISQGKLITIDKIQEEVYNCVKSLF